jgi:predicted kinase
MEKAGDKGESGFQRLVLMIGLPGAGKSTLARKIEESLSGKLKVEVISFDEIEKELS